jgi:hypothetical protein
MKRFILFSPVLLLFSSCGFFNSDYYTYTVKNESNHTLDFVYFSDTDPINNGIDTITIEKDSSYTIYESLGQGPHTFSEFLSTSTDSLKVIFDHEKILFYNGWTLESDSAFTFQRSPMNKVSYELINERKDGRDYTYTITEEDYKNAILIGTK